MSDATQPSPDDDLLKYQSLVLKHQGLVRVIALQFLGRGMDLDDLIQEGQLGLLHACRRFDGSRHQDTFLTYAAQCIKGFIHMALRDNGFPLRIPNYIQELLRKIRRGDIDPGDLRPKKRKCIETALRVMDSSTFGDEEFLDSLPDWRARDIEPREAAEEAAERVSRMLACLSRKQREAIRVWMEVSASSGRASHQQIADRLGIQRQSASQRLKDAFRNLRQEFPEGLAS